MKKSLYLCAACLIAISYCPAWADYDYSDAVGHGTASHSTPEWQWLGSTWNAESGPIYSGDTSDDGVTWSVPTLTRGQDVTFSFDMHRAGYGRHDYDQIKAWVDWNGNNLFDNSGSGNEVILYEKWDKGDTQIADNLWDSSMDVGKELQRTFTATVTVPDDAALGDIWLRARVHCWHIPFPDLTPYGSTNQGEVEDYKLTVVPVPSAMILAGLGLFVAQQRLRRRSLAK